MNRRYSPYISGPIEITYDMPGLTDGVSIFVRRVGDLLLDAWVEVVWKVEEPCL